MAISIRKKATGKGLHLYLDFNTQKGRYEFLDLYQYDEKKMGRLTPKQKKHNDDVKIIAEGIRAERKKDYDDGNPLNATEIRLRNNSKLIDFFDKVMKERDETSKNNRSNWQSAKKHLMNFMEGESILFKDVNELWVDEFRKYLLGYHKDTDKQLAQNSAVSYFTKLRVVLKEAVAGQYLRHNPLKKVKGIESIEVRREFLTIEELKKLLVTDCDNRILKQAFLFSCYTGMRWSDIHKLTWGEIQYSEETGYFIRFRQKKTAGEVQLYFPQEAYRLLGERHGFEERVFKKLEYSAWNNLKLREWVMRAGIQRKITFHCARHTYATLQLNLGTDITVVSNLLGHRNLKTTQIYAKITNKSKMDAATRISLF